jgi:tetratricopeptide (TPR) repeat protein
VDTTLRLARQGSAIDPDRRIVILRHLLEIDQTLEEGHRLLMSALAEAGRPADAIKQYTTCVEALRAHLEVGPSTETRRVVERIQSGALQPSRARPARDDNWSQVARRLLGTPEPRPIRGRAPAIQAVGAFAESERGALLIIGEAGAGKTRLAVECARRCTEVGAVVLAGLGYDFDGAAPYTPFVDAWTDVLRLVPGARNPFLSFEPSPSGSAQEDRLRLYRTVEESLTEVAGPGRVCLLIEDLHQADESSAHLFHHLARASRHLRLQLIGTVRQEEIHPGNPLHLLLSSLGRERMTTRVSLERLDLEATRELMQDLWGHAPDDAAVETTFRLAAGNPFFTEEIAAVLREGDAARFAPSSDLLETVRARMSRLGAEVERLLVAASVQGVRFDFEIARRAIGLEQETAFDALDAALSARVVEEQADRYRFRHALMREALYDSVSQPRRVYVHRATADAMEARGGPELTCEPELLAFHHHAAGNLDRALPYTLDAIRHAQSRLGFDEAITHSERALELMESLGLVTGPDGFRVLRDLGAMRVALGDLDAAVRDLDRAANLGSGTWTPGPAARCGALRLAGLALIEAGDLDAAEANLDAALAALGGVEEPGELCNVHYLYAQLRWHQSRHEEAFELAEKCLAVAEKAGDEEAIAKGYEMLALACHSLGEWKKGREYEEQRREVADGTLDVASAFDVHL